jgi:hypothetical protein
MTYRRVRNVAWRRIGEDTLLVNLARRRMLAVNGAGGAVWEALARGAAVSPGEAVAFLADLEAEGVVERVATEEAADAVPLSGGGAPAVVWREELNQLGGACAFHPGEGDLCNQGGTQFS